MSTHTPSADVSGSASAAGALVSLVSFIVSFFSEAHIWLQNLGLLVSVTAGIIAIAAGIYKFVTWIFPLIKSLFTK
jgi:hypothetical protein